MFKILEINSIRNRMVTGFLFLTLLILILAVVSLIIIDRITNIARINSSISQLEINTLSLIKLDNDFFNLETINENYFKTRESDLLKKHDSLNDLVSLQLKELIQEEKNKNYGIKRNLEIIDSTLSFYNDKFKNLESLVFRKGFKDFGIEGAMRYHVHILERSLGGIDVTNILQLRRHEKDFLLRNDINYLNAFKTRSDILLKAMEKQPSYETTLYHLREYQKCFVELVQIQLELGLSSKNGLRNELNDLTYSLSKQYYALSTYSFTQTENGYHNLRIFYVALISGAFFFSIFSGLWISRRLSEPIAKLSIVVRKAIASREVTKTDFTIKNAANEINTLAASFILLMNQLKIQMQKIKTKSNLLRTKNRELRKVNRELDNFLYSTAHDLRSPLSSLLGLIILLRYENRQQELLPYFDKMENSIHRSEEFILQIVNFSKNKRTKIAPSEINLNSIITGVFENHQFIEGASKITKTISIQENAPFYSDKNRIIILFNNLISNATKYADLRKEHPFIKIEVMINDDVATITFQDNGIGISSEHLNNIFEMFFRAHTSSNGSGLGLFIFKETIIRLNGTVTVESKVDIGTNFFIRLPNLRQTFEATLSTNQSDYKLQQFHSLEP